MIALVAPLEASLAKTPFFLYSTILATHHVQGRATRIRVHSWALCKLCTRTRVTRPRTTTHPTLIGQPSSNRQAYTKVTEAMKCLPVSFGATGG